MPPRPTRSSSYAVRPRASTWWRRAGGGPTCRRRRRDRRDAIWSITPTSCPGSNCAPRKARGCVSHRSTTCGQILLDEYGKLLGPKTRLVAFTQVSNALGTVTPAKQMIAMAHAAGAKVLVDGAQSVSHMPVNVQAIWTATSSSSPATRCSRRPASASCMARRRCSNETPPWQGGGNMIGDVTFEHTDVSGRRPTRFEAGTGNIADAVGLGAAIDYVDLDRHAAHIAAYEHDLLQYATNLMQAGARAAADRHGGRKGQRAVVCARWASRRRRSARRSTRKASPCARAITARSRSCAVSGSEATVRPSLAFYNTCAEVDALIAALLRIRSTRGAVLL